MLRDRAPARPVMAVCGTTKLKAEITPPTLSRPHLLRDALCLSCSHALALGVHARVCNAGVVAGQPRAGAACAASRAHKLLQASKQGCSTAAALHGMYVPPPDTPC